ncbi:MAG: flagellar export chaperone FliS [Rhizobacter sp.]|nr:flagellar export chaperone FliS [Rhizobacter sp.]
MFASAAFSAPTKRQLGAYQQVHVTTGVDGASPHRLVEMLFQGLLDSFAQARGAMRQGQIEAKGEAIGRAVRIIEEGLRAGLNVEEGGQLAADLRDLYAYVIVRLTYANRHNDESAIAECVGLIEPLSEAWAQIGQKAAA